MDQRISELEHDILRLFVRETSADYLCPTSLHHSGQGDMTVLLKHLKGCSWEEGIRTVHVASKAKTTTVTLVFQVNTEDLPDNWTHLSSGIH